VTELRRKSIYLDKQLQEAISELPEKSDINGLKSRINQHEKTINELNEELDIVNTYIYIYIYIYINIYLFYFIVIY